MFVARCFSPQGARLRAKYHPKTEILEKYIDLLDFFGYNTLA